MDRISELEKQLEQEREKVKGLESEGVKLFEWRLALHSLTPGGSEFCTPDACEQWVRKSRTSQHEYIIEQIKQRKGLQTQLSQLQALVRALPVVRIDLNGAYHDTLLTQPEDDAVKELLRYRAGLDATTPATLEQPSPLKSVHGSATGGILPKGGDGE